MSNTLLAEPTRDEKVIATRAMVEYIGAQATADFIVSLQEAVDGLTRNCNDFRNAFSNLLNANWQEEQSRKLLQLRC